LMKLALDTTFCRADSHCCIFVFFIASPWPGIPG
jgi:hypothetical protein